MSEFLNTHPALPIATITEDKGVRFLHLGTSWIQGAMQIAKPDAIALEYVQQMMAWMLFVEQPKHIVQFGLGSGALTKFCHQHFSKAKVTAVELNPSVISICRNSFFLPPDNDRLQVLQMDAMDFVNNPANKGAIDILQVDLYDEFAQGPVLDTPEFYKACADCLTPDGILTTNIFGDHASYEKNLHGILMAFDATAWLPRVDDENLIVIGFKRSPSIDFAALHQRAAAIRLQTNLPAKTWVNGLKEWMLSA
jgi:spermidine synthase